MRGVTKEAFAAMCEVVIEHKQAVRRGRKSNLSTEVDVIVCGELNNALKTIVSEPAAAFESKTA